MRYTTDHATLVDLSRRAGELAAAHDPLPARLALAFVGLSPEACGSTLLAAAALESGRAWDHTLEIYRWDAGRLADVLRTVDARYVDTEMALVAQLRDVDGGQRAQARLAGTQTSPGATSGAGS